MSIVLGGRRLDVAGVETISYLDDPKVVPRASDGSPRRGWIRGIVAHTVHGLPGALRPGAKPSTRAEWYARYQAASDRKVSWDFTVDTDGTVAWSNDPLERACWHGHTVNAHTLGFEMVQDHDTGAMYEATIAAAAAMIDFLTLQLGIQRQTPWRDGKPYAGRIERCQSGNNGARLVGVYGHRNVWIRNSHGGLEAVRGRGDPNDHLFVELARRGYETFDTEAGQDLEVWKARQAELGFAAKACDGIPGPATVERLRAKGHAGGVWVLPP